MSGAPEALAGAWARGPGPGRIHLGAGRLLVDLGRPYRCLSSAVLGGGLGWVRTWLDLEVPPDYSRVDPERHLEEASEGLAGPVVGMLTAAPVAEFKQALVGRVWVVGTVGLGWPLAAGEEGSARTAPHGEPGSHGGWVIPPAGTINLLIVVDLPLSDAGLVGAVQTAVEAKVGALLDAGVRTARGSPATGTATDCLCVACPPGGVVPFAGPATPHGSELARAVRRVVMEGSTAWKEAELGS